MLISPRSIGRICIVLAVCLLSASVTTGAEQKLNILLAFADDMGRYAGVYSKIDGPGTLNDVVRTPHIDHLAEQGVTFENAFVNAPSCTPCRSSLLSGQYFYRTGQGAILQGAVWDSSIPTFPLLLQQNGYHIGFSYKVWSPGEPKDAGFGGQKNGYHSAGRKINGFSQQVTQAVTNGTAVDQAKAILLSEARQNFQKFLDARPADQPFCFWFGPTNVHRTWIAGSGKKLWNIDPDSLIGKVPPFLPDVPQVREDLADYLGEIAAFDASVGELIAELKSRGEYDNTLIVISGDHGAPGFTNGKCNLYDFGTAVPLIACCPGQIPQNRVVTDFTTLMDLAPTFLEVGGVSAPEMMTGRSLWPVMTSEQSGRIDPRRRFAITGRERHVGKAREGNVPYPQRAIRTEDFLYIRNFKPDRWPLGDPHPVKRLPSGEIDLQALENETFITFSDMDASPTKAWLVQHRDAPQWQPFYERAFGKRPAEELYDLRTDRWQLQNVADDTRYVTQKQELAAQLMQVLEETGDPRLINNGQQFENPPFAGD